MCVLLYRYISYVSALQYYYSTANERKAASTASKYKSNAWEKQEHVGEAHCIYATYVPMKYHVAILTKHRSICIADYCFLLCMTYKQVLAWVGHVLINLIRKRCVTHKPVAIIILLCMRLEMFSFTVYSIGMRCLCNFQTCCHACDWPHLNWGTPLCRPHVHVTSLLTDNIP